MIFLYFLIEKTNYRTLPQKSIERYLKTDLLKILFYFFGNCIIFALSLDTTIPAL